MTERRVDDPNPALSSIAELLEQYRAGPATLRQSVAGLTAAEIDSVPIPGTWSIRQVICHLADSEILYADRINRVLAEDDPPLMKADPESFLAALNVANRILSDELDLIDSIRAHVAQILTSLPAEKFARRGIHSTDGPMTLQTVVERVTAHLPHHVAFINAKRQAILAGRR